MHVHLDVWTGEYGTDLLSRIEIESESEEFLRRILEEVGRGNLVNIWPIAGAVVPVGKLDGVAT